jgi:hypothetical protein
MAVNVSSPDFLSLPDGPSLRTWERESRRHGSGLDVEALIGEWYVQRVWDKQSLQPSATAGGALRAMAASLRIEKAEGQQLVLCNSIRFGWLKLSFIGPGRLEHRRPLLFFHFQQLILSLAEKTLFCLSLPLPEQKREPFFALVASGHVDSGLRWLAARGRGGGMALWVRKADSMP